MKRRGELRESLINVLIMDKEWDLMVNYGSFGRVVFRV